jgi:hypothetical protein
MTGRGVPRLARGLPRPALGALYPPLRVVRGLGGLHLYPGTLLAGGGALIPHSWSLEGVSAPTLYPLYTTLISETGRYGSGWFWGIGGRRSRMGVGGGEWYRVGGVDMRLHEALAEGTLTPGTSPRPPIPGPKAERPNQRSLTYVFRVGIPARGSRSVVRRTRCQGQGAKRLGASNALVPRANLRESRRVLLAPEGPNTRS